MITCLSTYGCQSENQSLAVKAATEMASAAESLPICVSRVQQVQQPCATHLTYRLPNCFVCTYPAGQLQACSITVSE